MISRGFVAAVAAYLAWGLFPIYFKALREVPPLEILAHRIAWSLAFLAILVTLRRPSCVPPPPAGGCCLTSPPPPCSPPTGSSSSGR
jgi:hypothetical protein